MRYFACTVMISSIIKQHFLAPTVLSEPHYIERSYEKITKKTYYSSIVKETAHLRPGKIQFMSSLIPRLSLNVNMYQCSCSGVCESGNEASS